MAEQKCVNCGKMYEEDESKKDIFPKKCGKKDCIKKNKKTNSHNKIDVKKYQKVKVADFNMSFGNMVIFMVKWVIASIPAMIILFFLWFILMMIVGGTIDWSIEI